MEKVTEEFSLTSKNFVMEVASNDGYLLKNFVEKQIPCLGIEPTNSTAAHARALGIDTLVDFFGMGLAMKIKEKYGGADLIACNNVYAHVPDINDFTQAIELSLNENGVVTIEFPHLLTLLKNVNLTLFITNIIHTFRFLPYKIFQRQNLRIFKIEKIPTHGGSVRIYGCKVTAEYRTCNSVKQAIDQEKAQGLLDYKFVFVVPKKAEKSNSIF